MNEDILFIEELIEWIEINLEQRPTLDDVTKISGYSKWHLQRKFKNIVGLQLASYMRGRILTRAAVALRISHLPIIEISDQLGFDSQQTFTRTFKKHFGITPHYFRVMDKWDIQRMIPRFNFYEDYSPEIKRVSLAAKELVGFTRYLNFAESKHNYSQSLSHMAMKDEILLDFFKRINYSCQRIYALFSAKNNDAQSSFYYSTAIDEERKHEIVNNRNIDQIKVPAGEFISISYQGSAKECMKFSIYLSNEILPKIRNEVEGSIELEIMDLDHCHAESKLRDISVAYSYLISVA